MKDCEDRIVGGNSFVEDDIRLLWLLGFKNDIDSDSVDVGDSCACDWGYGLVMDWLWYLCM